MKNNLYNYSNVPNQRNTSEHWQNNQSPHNPQIFNNPTVVPYLGDNQSSSQLYQLYQLSQANQDKESQPQQSEQLSLGQPLSNFPFVKMPSEATQSATPIFRPIDEANLQENKSKDSLENDKSNNKVIQMKLIKNFIQNERNGNIFYNYLTSISKTKEISEHFHDISIQCDKHYSKYKKIYKTIFNEEYEADNEIINTIVNFQDGIKMAIFAETDALKNLIQLMSLIDSTNIKEQLIFNFFEKLWVISYINILYIK